jgi:hypothetical protein
MCGGRLDSIEGKSAGYVHQVTGGWRGLLGRPRRTRPSIRATHKWGLIAFLGEGGRVELNPAPDIIHDEKTISRGIAWVTGDRLCSDYSGLNALSDFVPVVVCQLSDNTNITLEQGDEIQPKPRRRVQTRRLPVRDLAIGWAQRIVRLRRNQTQDYVRAMALINNRGQNHSRSRFRNLRARKGRDYDVPWRQVSLRSRSSSVDREARRASARSSLVHVSDQSTLLPFARSRSRVVQAIT